MTNKRTILAILVISGLGASSSFAFWPDKYQEVKQYQNQNQNNINQYQNNTKQYYNNQIQYQKQKGLNQDNVRQYQGVKQAQYQKVKQYKVINEEDVKRLVKQYKNEILSNKLYEYAYNKYWLYVLKNIASIKGQQLDILSRLLEQNNIDIDKEIDKDKFKEFKKLIDESKKKAIETLIQLNIENMKNNLEERNEIKDYTVKQILDKINKSNYAQVKRLVKELYNLWYKLSPDIYKQIKENNILISNYKQIKEKVIQIRQRNNFKNRFQNRLGSTNEEFKNKIEKQRTMVQTMPVETNKMIKEKVNPVIKNKAKQLVLTKYKNRLEKYDLEKLNKIVEKINKLEIKFINRPNILSVLEGVKESIIEIIEKKSTNETDSILDNLFK